MSSIEKPLHMAKKIIANCLSTGDLALDATAGNGHDTLFMARLVGDTGRVFSFDIQEKALLMTRQRLEEKQLSHRVQLIHCSHALIAKHIIGQRVKAAMFNLGYLPGGDHSICTQPGTTIRALEATLFTLKKGGLLTAVLYSGHPGGQEEKKAVLNYAGALEQNNFSVLHYEIINQAGLPPSLLVIEKI